MSEALCWLAEQLVTQLKARGVLATVFIPTRGRSTIIADGLRIGEIGAHSLLEPAVVLQQLLDEWERHRPV